MNERSTNHIPVLTWVYLPEGQRFQMDVSWGFEPQPHSIGTAWAKEMHLTTTGDGTWTLKAVTIAAPGYPDVENLGGRIALSDDVDSGTDLCSLLDEGLDFARSTQLALDEEDDVA